MASLPVRHTALIVVDVQKAFDELEAGGKRRNNAQAVKRIKDILGDFRAKGALVIHVCVTPRATPCHGGRCTALTPAPATARWST
jgi:nicotinamidase-related amidase